MLGFVDLELWWPPRGFDDGVEALGQDRYAARLVDEIKGTAVKGEALVAVRRPPGEEDHRQQEALQHEAEVDNLASRRFAVVVIVVYEDEPNRFVFLTNRPRVRHANGAGPCRRVRLNVRPTHFTP